VQRGVGGHNHNDKLGVSLHVGGEVLVADPGSGSYTRCRAVRDDFRSVRAHAVPVVDGREQAPLARAFALGSSPPCHLELLARAPGCAVVLVLTDHGCVDNGEVVAHAPLVVDARNATARVTVGREKIVKA